MWIEQWILYCFSWCSTLKPYRQFGVRWKLQVKVYPIARYDQLIFSVCLRYGTGTILFLILFTSLLSAWFTHHGQEFRQNKRSDRRKKAAHARLSLDEFLQKGTVSRENIFYWIIWTKWDERSLGSHYGRCVIYSLVLLQRWSRTRLRFQFASEAVTLWFLLLHSYSVRMKRVLIIMLFCLCFIVFSSHIVLYLTSLQGYQPMWWVSLWPRTFKVKIDPRQLNISLSDHCNICTHVGKPCCISNTTCWFHWHCWRCKEEWKDRMRSSCTPDRAPSRASNCYVSLQWGRV